jgi:hypothetical protein
MGGSRLWVPAAVCFVIALAASVGFLPRQSLWVDETTQLGGIRQKLPDLFLFLRGLPSHFDALDVPRDRMPPLSYLAGKGWSLLFGSSENSLRYMGSLFFACAAALTALAAGLSSNRRSDPSRDPPQGSNEDLGHSTGAAWMGGLLMALSPTAVYYSVEIRAYPLLMLTASASALSLVLAARRASWFTLTLLSLALTAAIYTHFFGVILSMSSLFALAFVRWQRKQSLLPIVLAGSCTACLSAGVGPFVIQAIEMSHSPGGHTAPSTAILARDFVKLWARMTAHGTTLIFPHFSAIAVAALTLLVVGALATCVAHRRDRASAPASAALIAALIGLATVGAASLVVHGFATTSVTYNLWIPPLLFVGLAGGVASCRSGLLRAPLFAAWFVMLGTQVAATVFLVTNGPWFAHGSHPAIAATVRSLGSNNVTIILAGPDSAAGMPYYPLRCDFGPELAQFALTPDGALGHPRFDPTVPPLPISSIHTPFVVLIVTHDADSAELAAEFKRRSFPPTAESSSPAISTAVSNLKTAGYRQSSTERYASLLSSEILLFVRSP